MKEFATKALAAAGVTADEYAAAEQRIVAAQTATPPTTPAAADTTISTKYTTEYAKAQTAWITANTKTLTAAEEAKVQNAAIAKLTAAQQTDYAAFVDAQAAGTTPTSAQTAANAALQTLITAEVKAWGDAQLASGFAVAVAGAFMAAAALF